MIALLLEAERTKSFYWHFERNYWVGSDSAMFVLVLLSIVAMAGYFVLPLANRRQTVGFWILRIATVTSDGTVLYLPLSTAIRLKYLEFRELFSLFNLWKVVKGKDAQGRTFYDRETGFMVVRF
jgi:hypothetical protein